MNDLVSIILPVYNVEKYLSECLETIIGQTYKRIEIIVVDDGSTDSCPKICDKYAKKDKRIKVIHQENKGLSGARNCGIEQANGKYITFVDSDDFISKDYISDLLFELKKNECDISACGTINVDENGNELNIEVSSKNIQLLGEEQIKALLMSKLSTTAWGKLYKIELFKNIRYPIRKYNEDTFTTYKVLDLSQKTIVINKPLYYYRKVQNSITNCSFNIKHMDGLEGIIERAEFVEKKYPQYKVYGNSAIVYTACKIFEKMIKSNYKNKEIEKTLKKNIKKYYWDFKKSKIYSFRTKMFCLISLINLKICRIIYSILLKSEVKK